MLAGLTLRPAATEFAFLVGIPTMFAATAYEFMKKWLLRYVQSHRFTLFAWYRIVLGVVLIGMVMSGFLAE